MTRIAIEIGDVGLGSVSDSGAVGVASPGYALLEGSRLVVGEAARAVSRIKPRFVSHRYWDQLDQSPVGRPFPRGLSHADLAHSQLSEHFDALLVSLGENLAGVSVLFAVPGSYSVDQLSLLLGIARASDIPVTGLIDSSLAALERPTPSDRALVLDVLMHRAVWTVLHRADDLSRERVESVEGAGLAKFGEVWVKLVAERFVHETRFDPLHRATTEQSLFDHLPAWVGEVRAHGSAVLELEASGRPLTVDITAPQLVRASAAQLGSLVEAGRRLAQSVGDCSLVVTSRAASIPGLAERLATIVDQAPIELPAGAAPAGALRRHHLIESPGRQLPFVTRLPWDAYV